MRKSASRPTGSSSSTKDVPGAIRTFEDALRAAEPRPLADAEQKEKKNYAERLSRHLATLVATRLRRTFGGKFKGITPTADGGKQESRARTGKGAKKLDVNYSTPQLGLGLGVSIKTLNFRDKKTKRYTKNYTRIDNELRAEALDYHVRQPYSVLVALIFIPSDSCDDAGKGRERTFERGVSSFGAAVRIFRHRSGRQKPRDEEQLFEGLFIALYDVATGDVRFFDVGDPPPRAGQPKGVRLFDDLVVDIARIFDERNDPPFKWADG